MQKLCGYGAVGKNNAVADEGPAVGAVVIIAAVMQVPVGKQPLVYEIPDEPSLVMGILLCEIRISGQADAAIVPGYRLSLNVPS